MKTNTNADAFASTHEKDLSKREYFAAMAMQGLISSPNMFENKKTQTNFTVAEMAVAFADALIVELNKSES